jgi:3-hydroxyisobutyrate dehydrogenase-like beta-hydroxyacid dehydrogenase
MGSRVAANLLKAGHQVRVWNRSRAPVDALARLGARPVATAREAFGGDAVFSMLADDTAVHDVIDGVLDGAGRVSDALGRPVAMTCLAPGCAHGAAPHRRRSPHIDA